MEKLPIDAIKIGDRRREDYGNIFELADSIKKYGLLHPIVVDQDNNLVAGHRRLQACTIASMRSVPIRRLENLTEAQLREIELEENLRRKDLTEYELSKNMVALAETAAEVLREQPREAAPPPSTGDGFFTTLAKNSAGGRPPKPDAEAKVADRIGVPLTTLRLAKEHVAAVEEFPVLKTMPKTNAIETAKNLRQLPPEKRETVLQQMEESQEQHERNVAAINHEYAVLKQIDEALHKAASLDGRLSDAELWLKHKDRTGMEIALSNLDAASRAISHLRQLVQMRLTRPQVIKGGKPLESAR